MSSPPVSIIIPVLNDAGALRTTLASLQGHCRAGCEIIVVDGGSTDGSIELAREHTKNVISSSTGRARQMNAGVACASGEVLLFLHADTQLPADASALLEKLQQTNRQWGYFSVRLSGQSRSYRVIEKFISLRSRITCVATGDQALFFRKAFFDACAGFADIPLMEDVELCKRAKKKARPLVLVNTPVITASRRWQQRGTVATVLLMWRLRLLYWLGVNPRRLAALYR